MLRTPLLAPQAKAVDRDTNNQKTCSQSFCVWFHSNCQCVCQCGAGQGEEELPRFAYSEMDAWDASKYRGDDINSYRAKVQNQISFINEVKRHVKKQKFVPEDVLEIDDIDIDGQWKNSVIKENNRIGALAAREDGVSANGETMLINACENGSLDKVKVLLEFNANPNVQNDAGQCALDFASLSGSAEIIDLLLTKNAELTTSPTFFATSKNNLEVVQLLVEKHHVDLSGVNELGESLVHVAITAKSLRLIEYFMAKGVPSVKENRFQRTPLLWAIEQKFYDAAILLIKANHSDVNEIDKEQNTALHKAVQRCEVNLVKVLLESNASIDMRNKRKQLPVECVEKSYSTEGNAEIVRMINAHVV